MTSSTSKIRKVFGVIADFIQDKIIMVIFKALEANEICVPPLWDELKGSDSGVHR